VIKKDDTKELYDRQKIKQAIKLAFAKRLDKFDRIDELLTELEGNRVSQSNEVSSQTI
jgi:transcriptional regulator NrdR family protein